MTGELSDLDRATLDFERQWWKHPGAKDAAIREAFDESPVGYYQRLNALIGRPEAVAYDVLLVKRLQRLRDRRAAARRMTI